MKSNFTKGLLLGTMSIYALTLFSCAKDYNSSESGNSYYILSNSHGLQYYGDRTNDPTLKAITIPCQTNNTLRLYYSDSAATFGLPDSLTIVSYKKAGHLGYKECYIEATSSTTDTYLSTGSEQMKVAAGKGEIDIEYAWMQHFTSTPQSDSVTAYVRLAAQ